MTQLTVAAKATVARHYGRAAAQDVRDRHLQRRLPGALAAGEPPRAVRRRRRLGGHALAARDGPNVLTYLPAALRNYPTYAATGDPAAHDAMLAAGFAPGSEFLWDYHYARLLGPHAAHLPRGVRPRLRRRPRGGHRRSARAARPTATPTTTTPRARSGAPGGAAGRADRPHRQAADHAARHAGHAAADRAPTRRLRRACPRRGPRRAAPLLRDRGRQPRRRPATTRYPDRLRPILPCFRTAFAALERWTRTHRPPARRDAAHDRVGDLANTCSLSSPTEGVR